MLTGASGAWKTGSVCTTWSCKVGPHRAIIWSKDRTWLLTPLRFRFQLLAAVSADWRHPLLFFQTASSSLTERREKEWKASLEFWKLKKKTHYNEQTSGYQEATKLMCDTWVTWFTGIWLLQGQPFVLLVLVFPSSFKKWFAQINIQAAAKKAKVWDVDEWPCFASLEIGLELESAILAWLMALKCKGVQTHPLFCFFFIPCPHFLSLSSSQRSCPQTDFDILNYLKQWHYSRLKVSACTLMEERDQKWYNPGFILCVHYEISSWPQWEHEETHFRTGFAGKALFIGSAKHP